MDGWWWHWACNSCFVEPFWQLSLDFEFHNWLYLTRCPTQDRSKWTRIRPKWPTLNPWITYLPGIHPIITKQLLTVHFHSNLRQATNCKFASSWKLLRLYEIWLDLVPDLSGFYLNFLFQNCVLKIGSDREAIKKRICVIQRYQRVLLYVRGMNSYSVVWQLYYYGLSSKA